MYLEYVVNKPEKNVHKKLKNEQSKTIVKIKQVKLCV